jgi:COP9 signalosome complex subunit 2
MLMKSDINPFDSQETKPYQNDPRIAAMTDLVYAYQRDDIYAYEDVLQKNKDLLADPFIAENIDEVTRNMRTKAVLKLIAPYTRMRLAWVAERLRISELEAQDILSYLIVDGRVHGRIDEHRGTVEIESSGDVERARAIECMASAVADLYTAIFNHGDGFRTVDMAAGGYSESIADLAGVHEGARPGAAGRTSRLLRRNPRRNAAAMGAL